MLNDSLLLDRAFQALADPARRDMLERLAQGPATVSELGRPLPMSLPGVLQHLKVLEESGLVRSTKQGRIRTCHIEPAAFAAAYTWIAEQRAIWEARLDRFEDYLATLTNPETNDG